MDSNVIRDGNTSVYSDGEDREEAAYRLALEYPGDQIEEIIASDKHYMPNYTFSSVRQNILNWYPFKKDAEILEVGAGMGAITGALIGRAKHVTSIELSEQRARVIRARYKDVDNLTVITENINNFQSDKKYDYVVIIGVMEYAAVFSDSKKPYNEFLESATKFLKEDGVVLTAIENRFGLKYWCGSSEDHLFKPFIGVEGYKESKTAKTFSKNELSEIFNNSGFVHQRFYYPLPDYKFPQVIYTDESLPDPQEIETIHFTYHNTSIMTMDERDLYQEIIKNNTFGFFANSFLIESSKRQLISEHPVRVNAHSEKRKENRVITTITNEGKVIKEAGHRNTLEHLKKTQQNSEDLSARGIDVWKSSLMDGKIVSDFCKFPKADTCFANYLKSNTLVKLLRMIDELRDILMKSSEITFSNNAIIESGVDKNDCNYGPILKKGYVDCVFTNCFYDENELKLYVFDQEFIVENLPLKCILYYAVNTTYRRAKIENTVISLDSLLKYIEVSHEEADAYDRFSDVIWSNVRYKTGEIYGADGDCNTFHENITLKYILENDKKELNNLNQSIRILSEEIADQKRVITKAHDDIHNLANELKKEETLERQIENLRADLNNKKGHIEQLLESERQLSGEVQLIKSTKMYKMNTIVWKVASKLLPMNSKRRFLLSLTLRSLRHPIRTMRKFSFSRVRNLFRDLNERDIESVSQHFNECVGAASFENKIEIVPFEEITSLETCEKLVFEQQESPVVSIIIPVYNQFTYTYHCLSSILKNSKDVNYEVIIADDCSNDLTTKLTDIVENILVVKTHENLRFIRNCNNAARHARGKYILFLNNDTQVQDNWLRPLVDLCENDHTIGMTGSKLVYANGKLQEAGGIIWKDGSAWNYGNGQDPSLPEYNYVKDVDYISGASILIRSDLWDKIGGFDEHFVPAYCEDSDLAFAVRKEGFRVVYQPASVVVHFEGISNGTDIASGVKKYQVENAKKLGKKWSDEFSKQYPNGTNVFKARERSKGKKVILMIDHYVPHIDQDAGSKTIYQYLQMLVKQGFDVKFIGDNFYQHEPYTTILEQLGIEVLYGSYYADHIFEWIKNNKNNIDYVFLNRPHISIKYIDFLKKETKAKIIYYGHDLHFLRNQREYELTGDKKKLKDSEEWKTKELYLMKQADISYYPSIIEENEIHKIDSKIAVKAITAYVYDKFNMTINDNFDSREGILFVGGFGHDPNLDAVQWYVENIWPKVREQLDINFYIVGSKAPNSVKELDGKNGIIVKGFVSDEELEQLYANCRLVVVPLRYGAGVKGKVVEAIYNGMPIVTTSVGAEGIAGAEAFLDIQDNADTFADAVVELYQDTEKMKAVSNMSQEYIKENFSTEAVWNIIKEDFS